MRTNFYRRDHSPDVRALVKELLPDGEEWHREHRVRLGSVERLGRQRVLVSDSPPSFLDRRPHRAYPGNQKMVDQPGGQPAHSSWSGADLGGQVGARSSGILS